MSTSVSLMVSPCGLLMDEPAPSADSPEILPLPASVAEGASLVIEPVVGAEFSVYIDDLDTPVATVSSAPWQYVTDPLEPAEGLQVQIEQGGNRSDIASLNVIADDPVHVAPAASSVHEIGQEVAFLCTTTDGDDYTTGVDVHLMGPGGYDETFACTFALGAWGYGLDITGFNEGTYDVSYIRHTAGADVESDQESITFSELVPFAWLGIFAVGASQTSSTTVTGTTTRDVAAGEFVIVDVAFDEITTGRGVVKDIVSITVGALSLTRPPGGEYALGNGDSASVGQWSAQAGSTIASGATVTVTLAAARTAKCFRAFSFSKSPTRVVHVDHVAHGCGVAAANPSSLSCYGTHSGPGLTVRSIGREGAEGVTDLTPSTDYSLIALEQSGTAAGLANVGLRGEYSIFAVTGTDNVAPVSAPTDGGASTDYSSILVKYVQVLEAPAAYDFMAIPNLAGRVDFSDPSTVVNAGVVDSVEEQVSSTNFTFGSGLRPVYDATSLNGLPGAEFDGVDDIGYNTGATALINLGVSVTNGNPMTVLFFGAAQTADAAQDYLSWGIAATSNESYLVIGQSATGSGRWGAKYNTPTTSETEQICSNLRPPVPARPISLAFRFSGTVLNISADSDPEDPAPGGTEAFNPNTMTPDRVALGGRADSTASNWATAHLGEMLAIARQCSYGEASTYQYELTRKWNN